MEGWNTAGARGGLRRFKFPFNQLHYLKTDMLQLSFVSFYFCVLLAMDHQELNKLHLDLTDIKGLRNFYK